MDKSKTITAYKGFEKDFTCRGFQFEVGKTYNHKGKVKVCESGFHACENPLDVLHHYPAATSRFALVKGGGRQSREENSDSKIAFEKITVEVELSLPELIKRGLNVIFNKASTLIGAADKYSSGNWSTAATSGNWSTAATSGDRSTAATSGDGSTAATSGYRSTAATSGNWSTAATSGDGSTAATSGQSSAALAHGENATVSADQNGCFVAATECNYINSQWVIVSAAHGITGRDGIKAGVLYRCKGGKLVEVSS